MPFGRLAKDIGQSDLRMLMPSILESLLRIWPKMGFVYAFVQARSRWVREVWVVAPARRRGHSLQEHQNSKIPLHMVQKFWNPEFWNYELPIQIQIPVGK